MTATTTATYINRGGTGKLWLPGCDIDSPILAYNSSALATSGALTPTTSVKLGGGASACAEAVAFDTTGNMWVSDSSSKKLTMFTPAQLEQSPIPAPSIVLTNPDDSTQSFNQPQGIAFDKSGNLWVINYLNNKLVRFTPSQLAATGSPIPSVVIGSTILDGLSTISKGYDLAFDASGNLWLVNFAAKTIVKWNAADLSVSGAPTPSVQIKNDTSGGGSTLSSVNGLAFDSSGNLWVANSSSFANANRVSKYNVSSLSGSSVVTPSMILTFATGTVPINLAFDNSGALWVYVTTDPVRS